MRGGSWDDNATGLQSSAEASEGPEFEDRFQGFRVATVPEPGTASLLILGAAGVMTRRRRRA